MDTEEAALLHEEATMTIEELLVRYGQNRNAIKHAAAMRYIIKVVMIYVWSFHLKKVEIKKKK